MDKIVSQRAQQWLIGNFDNETKLQVRHLLENDEKTLIDSFYKELKFGTGGLRGKLGVGTNRMNIYTVGRATQALANYLKKQFQDRAEIKVVIAHDSRINSRLFAETTANIFSNNKIKVFLFESLRPTPELSFAIRELQAQAGVVITASHNPKEYNGYKVYWEDGGQIISPHDKNIMSEMEKLSYDEIEFRPDDSFIQIIGKEIDQRFIEEAKKVSILPEVVKRHKNLKIVYTPLHGTGITLMPLMMEAFGFENLIVVEEQKTPDGNFPTVKSPNPENPEALELALKKAREVNADLVLATDPDADRVGVAVKDSSGEFRLLNGNQVGSLLTYYKLSVLSDKKIIRKNSYIAKTIVTTDLIKQIADSYHIKTYETLTGFKYIADVIRKHEDKEYFLLGAEESFGYLLSDFVRDKDAISSSAMIAEVTAWALSQGKTLFDLLIDIYLKYGLYYEVLLTQIKEGKEGEEEIKAIMDKYRNSGMLEIAGNKIVMVKDYLAGSSTDLTTGKVTNIELPKSNVLQFYMEDGTIISVRPSGTEPKIKYYFSLRTQLGKKEDFEQTRDKLEQRLKQYRESLGI